MIINKDIRRFIVLNTASLDNALKVINENRNRICYVVDEHNVLCASLSDGDVRRWLLETEAVNLKVEVGSIANKNFFSLSINHNAERLEAAFNQRISTIPLVDDLGRLVAVAEYKQDIISIDKVKISYDDPVFVIAEVGNNHQGDIRTAKQLVDAAIAAKVDCVKFQLRSMDKLYKNSGDSSDASADLGAQYTLDLLSKFQLSDQELFEVFDYCKSCGVLPLCTPWDLDSLKKLEEYGMPAYKIASADFTNYELLEAVAKTGKPIFCSTGMSSETEIHSTVSFLRKQNAQFVLLHCNSTYPTPFKDVNLRYLKHLRKTTRSFVGYSGHERGWSVPVAAVALGARVIEKHITFDKAQEGNDHKVSLLPHEFKEMVVQIRQVEESLGNGGAREITQGELINREVLAKSLIINRDLEPGETIMKHMIEVKSPGQGLQPNRVAEIIGKPALRRFRKGDYFYESDVDGNFTKKLSYKFSRPHGIPVRFHDYEMLTSDVELDFVEFHFSYRDLDVQIGEYIVKPQHIDFAVHAPELFSNDHLLDLSSPDEIYRMHSVQQLKRVIEKTNELAQYFPKTKMPVVVVNAGGWKVDGFLSSDDKKRRYDIVKESFENLDLSSVEVAIQTMPPFPWHFGGQSHHSLFLDASEIANFCQATGLKICLDISHSMMACNYYGWDLEEFVRTVAPYIVHMHIVDAKGIDGEGVQIGHGDVNFERLGILLNQVAPNVQFIPEVWQGHKNRGQGFWYALSYLERYLK